MRKYKLPKKFRKEWLNALMSGEYEQTTGRLYSEGKYCCLGVAADILGCDKTSIKVNKMPYDLHEEKNKFPKCLVGDGKRAFSGKLANMNDGGKTFKEIAKYIKETTVGV